MAISPANLISKIRKIIELSKDKAIINNAYFNPAYADRLMDKAHELKEYGFNASKTETESHEGTIISGILTAPNMEELSLGSILLDGKSLVVKKSLVPVDNLINFIEDNITS